jgi:hypothetical protein
MQALNLLAPFYSQTRSIFEDQQPVSYWSSLPSRLQNHYLGGPVTMPKSLLPAYQG